MGYLSYCFLGLCLVVPAQSRSFLYQIDDSVEQNLVERPTYRTDRKTPIKIHNSAHSSRISVQLQGHNTEAQSTKPSSHLDHGLLTGKHTDIRTNQRKVEKSHIKEESLVLPYKINKDTGTGEEEKRIHHHGTASSSHKHSKQDYSADHIKPPRVLLHTKHKILSRPREEVYLQSRSSESNTPVHIRIEADSNNNVIATVNDQSPGNKEIEKATAEHEEEREHKNTPTLDIPEKYLKIPESNDKLKSLVGGIKRRHPCVRELLDSKDGNLNNGGHSRENKYVRLCRNSNRNLRHKHRSDKSKHESESGKNGENEISKKLDGNVIPPPTAVMLNEAGSEKETSISHSQDYFQSVPLEKGDNVISISEIDKESHKDSLKASTDNVKSTSIFPPQFSNLKNTSNNVSSSLHEMTNGHDVISQCSLSQNNNDMILKPENLKTLIDEIGDNTQCWQSGALKGVYHLEQFYKHTKDRSQLSQQDIDGIEHIICYLIKELENCKSNSKGLSNKQTETKVTTSTKKPVTKATTANPVGQQNFQNGFDLDWEANLLFY